MITDMVTAMNASRRLADGPRGASGLRLWLPSFLLLAGLLVVAMAMLRDSLAFVIRPADPALALRIDPHNAEIQASRAEQLLRLDPSANRRAAEELARQSLRRSPVSAAGATMLATARDLAGDTSTARRLMDYSESVSRRDLPTQLWFVEDAVRRNDIPLALHHYDIALRSSVVAKPLLFPVLIQATAQPAVVDGLIDTLAARPLWAESFLDQVSHDGPDLGGVGRLLVGLARRGYTPPEAAAALATARMVDAARYDLAWQVYVASHPRAMRGAVRDPNFVRAGVDEGPFDWALVPAEGVVAEPRRYGTQDGLSYAVATGAGGVAARQLLLASKGTYRLTGRAFAQLAGSAPAQLRLRCAGSGAAIATIVAPAKDAGFASRIVIPSACPAQWLELWVDGGENPAGAAGAIGDVRVLPMPEAARS